MKGRKVGTLSFYQTHICPYCKETYSLVIQDFRMNINEAKATADMSQDFLRHLSACWEKNVGRKLSDKEKLSILRGGWKKVSQSVSHFNGNGAF